MERGVANDLVRTAGRKNQHVHDDDGRRSHDEGGATRRSLRGEMDSMDSLTSALGGGDTYAAGETLGARLGGRSLWLMKVTVEQPLTISYVLRATGSAGRRPKPDRSSGAADDGEGKRDEKSATEALV